MAAEKRLSGLFNITIIPTPREITENCGLSIKINTGDMDKIITEIKNMEIPAVLYALYAIEKGVKKAEMLIAI
jgi:hypothetical protein